jgi:hypothetical protein
MIVILAPKRITDKTVKSCEDGLWFIRGGSLGEIYEWDKITNIFCWGKLGVLAAIDDDGNVALGNVLGRFKKEIEKIWERWEEKIQRKDEMNHFVYPQWCRGKEMRTFAENIFWGIGAGIIFTLLYFWMLIDEGWNVENIGYFLIISGAVFIAFCFWFGFYALFRRLRKNFDEIHIFDDEVEILYEDGSIRLFKIRDIKKCKLRNALFIGKIVFDNGTTLIDTERISYFPVFRQKLLKVIEASKG